MNMEETVEENTIKRRHYESQSLGYDRLFLSEELLIQVLSKLPVKSLLRFRRVCKRWRYLISHDPYFFEIHLQSKSKQPNLLFSSTITSMRRWNDPYSISLQSTDREGNPKSRFEVKFNNHYARLLPTRFDLVCVHDDPLIHICNPTTHEFITLPEHPFTDEDEQEEFHIGNFHVGFGYVQSIDDYKVVLFAGPDYNLVDDVGSIDGFSIDPASFTTKCYVFTMGIGGKYSSSFCLSSCSSRVWRAVVDSPYHIGYSSPPAFVNGAIHWLVHYDSYIDIGVYHGRMIDPNNTIVAFDVKSEEFRLVSHPKGCLDIRSISTQLQLVLVELRGMLCLAYTKDSKMEIWMFKDYSCINGTWVKEYNIDLNFLNPSYQKKWRGDFTYYAPREIEDTEVLIETHMIGAGYYHLQTTSFKGFMHSRQMPHLQFCFYVESLRSLKQ